MTTYNIAVIAGDGIGKEVMPEGLKVVQAAAEKFGLSLNFHHFDWGGCDYYLEHNRMMPENWKDMVPLAGRIPYQTIFHCGVLF